MQINFLESANEDFEFFIKSGNKTVLKKINELVKSIIQSPFEGIGKPEPLKHDLAGKWSRRINREHRMIYQVENDKIYIWSLRGHY